MNTDALIRQGDPPHGGRVLGRGPRTIAQAGCLLCTLVMAHRAIHGGMLGVLEAHARIDVAKAFVGSGIALDKAATALSMRVVERAAFHADEAADALAIGQPVIVGVDYKAGASSGLSDADHFVLGVGATALSITIADPAVGRLDSIDFARPSYRAKPCRLAEMIILAGVDPVCAS